MFILSHLLPGCAGELERAKGIEPSYAAWEAAVLPLNYARKINDLARVARPNVLQNVLHFP